ncbi:MAG: hypothetical protein NT062_02595, partial [Proteobacteria bacterium]|nr:hypothetical protein [Pseudomonadota bacterium]
AIALTLVAAGCGEDEGGGTKPTAPGAAGPAVLAAAAGSAGPTLVPAEHVEDRVVCPVPKKVEDLPSNEDRCEPTAPIPCKDKAKPYCLAVPVAQNAAYCFSCIERDNIRYAFKDRDFAPETNRDPFQSFVLSPVTVGPDKPTVDTSTQVKCNDTNSFMPSYSYLDLKLVGIVTQGTLRKGLITGGRSSAIVKRNDCVGKEKALVKEVGDGYATFVSQPEPGVAGARAVEYTILLRPNTLALNAPESPPSDRVDRAPTNVPSPTSVPSPNAKPDKPEKPARVEMPVPRMIPSPTPVDPPQTLKP